MSQKCADCMAAFVAGTCVLKLKNFNETQGGRGSRGTYIMYMGVEGALEQPENFMGFLW